MVSEVEPGEAHTGEDLEEEVDSLVHETVAEVLQGTGVVAGNQDQVRKVRNSEPEEHWALIAGF